MNQRKKRAFVVICVLLAAALACNFPTRAAVDGGEGTPLPAANQTLTALFSITPNPSATFTLPPVVTATPGSQQGGQANEGGGVNPPPATATLAPTRAPATATNRPPATSAPAATATIPNVRPRAQVVAKYLDPAPTIDGDWSEWKDITTEYPANNVVWGRDNWTGEDDLAASFHVGWDNNYLYVAVKVRDDQYVQNATGENIFKGDSVEILLDTKLREDFYYTRLSPDDFQLGINPGRPDVNGTREAYLWMPGNIAGARSGVKITSLASEGVYRVEAAIPWTVFETTPVNGTHMGFALSVSDNDDPGQDAQQSMVSNVASRSLVDPTTWGDLFLTK